MRAFGWTILALVFLVEVLCAIAAGFVGAHLLGTVGAVLGPLLVIIAWGLFASPKARFATPARRLLVKIAVFVSCSVGLMLIGQVGLGAGLLGVSGVVNGLAQLPEVQALVSGQIGRGATRTAPLTGPRRPDRFGRLIDAGGVGRYRDDDRPLPPGR